MDASVDRIAVPLTADRRPAASTRVAAGLARQAGLGVEFVDAGPPAQRERRVDELNRRCRAAAAAGAGAVAWRLLDGTAQEIGPYVTWSGARMGCVGTGGHGRIGAFGACGVPLLVIGPSWRPGDDVTRRVVVGLHGPTATSDRIAAAAMALAERLGAELTLIEVVRAGWRSLDVPACAHLQWVARELPAPAASYDTVAAERADDGLGRFLGVATVTVVGAPSHHRRLLGGVAGRLVRRSPGPVLVVPSLASGHGRLPVPRAT